VDLVVIGAVAYRTWVQDEQRVTEEVALAVGVDLSDLGRLTDPLLAGGWRQDQRREHRWLSPWGARIDLLRAGERARRDRRLDWPLAETRMSLVGFDHVFTDAVERELAAGLTAKVVPLVVLTLLKIVSFLDQPTVAEQTLSDQTDRNTDASDHTTGRANHRQGVRAHATPAARPVPNGFAHSSRVRPRPETGTSPVWSADGKSVACVSSRAESDPDRTTDANVYVVEAREGAEPRPLTTHAGEDGGVPAWSPDGWWVSYLREDVAKYCAHDQYRLAAVPAVGGEARLLTAPLDRSMAGAVLRASDGQSLRAVVEDDRTSCVVQVTLAGLPVESLPKGGRG
jgi:hypothetical protein